MICLTSYYEPVQTSPAAHQLLSRAEAAGTTDRIRTIC